MPTKVSLPLGMKVQIDLVDQHDRAFAQRLFTFWKGVEEPPGQIHGHGEHRLISEAEVRERRHTGWSSNMNAGLIGIASRDARSADFDIVGSKAARKQRGNDGLQSF